MKSIEEFCALHDACYDGARWAREYCHDMDEVWKTAKPDWFLWVATRPNVLTDKELRLFACFCADQVSQLLTDNRLKQAVEISKLFAVGFATEGELRSAEQEAIDVEKSLRYVEWGATMTGRAFFNAARCAVHSAHSNSLRAAKYASGTSASAIGWYNSRAIQGNEQLRLWDKERDNAYLAQCKYLRNLKPNFE